MPTTVFSLLARALAALVVALPLVQGHHVRGEQGPGKDAPTPEALVAQLNSPTFREREAAGRALVALGTKAVPALKAGLAGGSPEAAERCQKLLAAIRKDDADRFARAFAADKEFKATFDHPVWKRWAKVVGADRPSRELFAEVLGAAGAAEALAQLEDDPKAAKKLYPAELARLHALVEPRAPTNGGLARRSTSSCFSLGEAVYGVYLGTYAGVTSVEPGPGRGGWPFNPEMDALESVSHLMYRKRGPWSAEATDKGEHQSGNKALVGPKDKLLAANVLNLKNPPAIELVLRHPGGFRDVAESLAVALPVARMVCREASFPITVRAASWLYLAEAGEKDYLPDIGAGQDDPTLVQEFFRSDEKSRRYLVLVSDVSLAAQLLMHKQDPKDFGYIAKLNEGKRAVDRSAFAYGFPDDATRKAAHDRALAFLAKVPPPKPSAKP
jgi:hypothetical protein